MSKDEVAIRKYLEKMMIRFVLLGVPLEQAVNELIEIEAHIHLSGNDPFDDLGEPQRLASSLVPVEQRRALFRSHLRRDITAGVGVAIVLVLAMQTVLSWLGEAVTSVPRMLIMFVLACLYGIGQLSFGTIMMGVRDDEESLRLRGLAQACLVAFGALIVFIGALRLAGADFSGSEPFVLSTRAWSAMLVTALVVGLGSYWRGYRLKGQEELLVEGGVTGQIVYEMNHNGFIKGWVRYGPNGEDLRSADYSIMNGLQGPGNSGG